MKPIAHPSHFKGHGIQSSLDLREAARKAPRCSHPHLLLWTNLPCAVAGLIHYALFNRILPAFLFFFLALASTVFHYHVDVCFQPSLFWTSVDRWTAYLGILYHTFLLASRFYHLQAWVAAVICVGSLWFYKTAYRLWEQGDFPGYVRWHCLWHLSASAGTLMFAMMPNVDA